MPIPSLSATITALSSLRHEIPVFFDRRIASVFILGIAQGLPWVMIGSMLTLWLKESGTSRTQIGFAALIFTVYAINFLWSPLVEMIKPRLFVKTGHRQSWILLCQCVISISCFLVSTFDAGANAQNIVLLCLIIATFSATQDIAIDAYRVDSFASDESKKISAASGAITAGWWTGYAGLGAIPLFLSDNGWHWPSLYILLGLLTLILAATTIFLPNPKVSHSKKRNQEYEALLHTVVQANSREKKTIAILLGLIIATLIYTLSALLGLVPGGIHIIVGLLAFSVIVFSLTIYVLSTLSTQHSAAASDQYLQTNFDATIAWILTALVAPLKDFFSRNGLKLALALLAFILFFKIGEAFLGRMSIVFYKEIGFTNTQIATYSKLVTWWLTIVFSFLGALVNARFGLVNGLLVSGIAMASTNLIFSLIAIVGPDVTLYIWAVVLDGFAQAWSTVAFVAFISLLCNQAFSATQYALMASLSNLGRTTIASSSGLLVDSIGGNWALFFALTTVMVIPSLIILWRLRHYINSLLKSQQN